jgi:hypothetical protein
MSTAFMGMRGTSNWAENQVPENWQEYILYEKPNGKSPLYAMTSMFRKETVDSYKFNWWTKTMPTQAGAASVYIDTGLATAYVYSTHQATAGISGGVVYVKVAEALAKEFNVGALAILRDSDQLTVDVAGRVIDTFYNGANSFVAVKLIEADDNHSTSATYNLATVDRILRYGSGYPEGSTPPNAINYDPDAYYNYVQSFRNTLDLTVEALATHLRTGDAYKEAVRECVELHSIDLEKTAFWGRRFSGTGDNNKPLRLSGGIYEFLLTNNSSNIVDYMTDTGADYAGKTWLQAGKKWFNTKLTELLRYADGEILAFCGDAALLGIMELAEAYGDIQLKPGTVSYGIDVVSWQVPAGKVHLKIHPLFSHETTNQNSMVLLHPKNCKFCPLVGGGYNFNTKLEKDMQLPGQHSKMDGFSTKGGWKFYFENQFMWMHNVGKDNIV